MIGWGTTRPVDPGLRRKPQGPDHFSLAFTYDCIAWAEDVGVTDLIYI